MSMNSELRKILLTGLGAMVISGEKIKELIDTSTIKGEQALEQYKVLNKELKRTINIKVSMSDEENPASASASETEEQEGFSLAQILEGIDSLTQEEQEVLASKLTTLRREQ